ncbi:MAG: histidine kinase, partial [Cyanobacteria bacterium RYN_339]|nr:histidine kinase [Cyanobacteria bacterium RYN_339]
NLLSNALKFTHRGGRVAARLDVAEQAVRFEVEDSGIGIAEENLDRIFTKFYQVDASTTRKAGGVGLGLSISKSIVEVGHGGQMWAERLERGTLVVAQIPLPN